MVSYRKTSEVSSTTVMTKSRVTWFEAGGTRVATFTSYLQWGFKGVVEFLRFHGVTLTDGAGILLNSIPQNLSFRVRESYCKYIGPARFDDVIEVSTVISEISEKIIIFDFTIISTYNSMKLASGYISCIFIDPTTNRAVEVPQTLVRVFDDYH